MLATPIKKRLTIQEVVFNRTQRLYKFPRWQRHERKKKNNDYIEFRNELIESVFKNIDIPKIYLYSEPDGTYYYVIDGGHRIRTLDSFMNGETTVKLDDVIYFYKPSPFNDGPTTKKHESIKYFDEEQKDIFNSFKLDVVIYENISELNARDIFNKLNHQKPLTIAECINSFSSPFVDMILRIADVKYSIQNIDGDDIVTLYSEIMKTRKIDHHEYLTDFIALFSVIYYSNNSTSRINKNIYYEAGKNSLAFVKKIGVDDKVLKLEQEFINSLKRLFECILYIQNELPTDLKWKPKMGEIVGIHMIINDDYKSKSVIETITKVKPYMFKCFFFSVQKTAQMKREKILYSMAADGEIAYNEVSKEIIEYNRKLMKDFNNDGLIRAWGTTSQKNTAPLLIRKYLKQVIDSTVLQEKYSPNLL